MKKIILFSLIILSFFIIACNSSEKEYEKVIYNIPDDPEIFFCESDADCGHVTGCNEEGGSPCVNIEYIFTYGPNKKNCDPNDVSFCYTCECIDNKCTNVLDQQKYGC
jgi:hypothetical protein